MASRNLWPGLWHPYWRLFHSRAATKVHSCKERIALSLACLFQARAPSATASFSLSTPCTIYIGRTIRAHVFTQRITGP